MFRQVWEAGVVLVWQWMRDYVQILFRIQLTVECSKFCADLKTNMIMTLIRVITKSINDECRPNIFDVWLLCTLTCILEVEVCMSEIYDFKSVYHYYRSKVSYHQYWSLVSWRYPKRVGDCQRASWAVNVIVYWCSACVYEVSQWQLHIIKAYLSYQVIMSYNISYHHHPDKSRVSDTLQTWNY